MDWCVKLEESSGSITDGAAKYLMGTRCAVFAVVLPVSLTLIAEQSTDPGFSGVGFLSLRY